MDTGSGLTCRKPFSVVPSFYVKSILIYIFVNYIYIIIIIFFRVINLLLSPM